MNLADVMNEIAERVKSVGVTAYPFPTDAVTLPAAVVSFPDDYNYDETYDRGTDEMIIPVIVLVAMSSPRVVRDNLGQYCDGASAKSVKQVLEDGVAAGAYPSLGTLKVPRVQFDPVTVGTTRCMAAMFDVVVTGPGS